MSRALLIFARHPFSGTAKTRLALHIGREKAARLYECMLQDVVEKAASVSGIEPLLCHAPSPGAAAYFRQHFPGVPLFPQQGEDLGERLLHGMRKCFGEGYSACAVIGSDSPDLPADRIVEAFTLLESDDADAVFGPAADGGYYLVATKKGEADIFSGIPWSTGEVLKESLRRCAECGLRVRLLPEWYDLDEPADLARPGLLAEGSCAPRTRAFLLREL